MRGLKWWIIGGAVLIAALGGSVHAFILKQRHIGALQEKLSTEQAGRAVTESALRVNEDLLTAARLARVRADTAAARALRRAVVAEARFAATVARVDTQYVDLPDSTLVPLSDLRAVRNDGVVAVAACQASRDTLRIARDSLQTECDKVQARAVLQQARAESFARELQLERDKPPAYRLEWRGAAVGAAVMWLAQRLGLLRN